jgi:hypothetical protein
MNDMRTLDRESRIGYERPVILLVPVGARTRLIPISFRDDFRGDWPAAIYGALVAPPAWKLGQLSNRLDTGDLVTNGSDVKTSLDLDNFQGLIDQLKTETEAA